MRSIIVAGMAVPHPDSLARSLPPLAVFHDVRCSSAESRPFLSGPPGALGGYRGLWLILMVVPIACALQARASRLSTIYG